MAENQIIITTSSRVLNESNSHNGAIQRKAEHGAKQSYHVHHPNDENWQTLLVGASKNKLKRKKKLSASLTSVGDAVNQEKRTRIEGIQLNCRGKLHAKDTRTFESATVPVTTTAKDAVKTTSNSSSNSNNNKVERPVIIGGVTTTNPAAPQRVKRKLQENLDTIQKLNALTEQLRLEVNGLKSTLITERGAVRALRAQNDADCRKWKCEIKKLQQTLETTKKSNCNVAKKPNELAPEGNCTYISADGLINYEIQRLTNEIAVLKEANRTKDERSQIIGQADRLKAADMRQLKNAYENRLTHIQKSAKIEITRLLEEIKTKERNIGQLKKDLMILQNPKKPNETKFKTNETSQKPKKKPLTNNEKKPPTAIKVKNETEPISQAQVTTEITQLKNIELINNRKNAHKSTTIITKTKQDEMRGVRLSVGGGGGETSVEGATAWMTTLLTNAASKPKDHNSDTDSALSSAPPSISPQPPSSGTDSGVMWQTLQDLDKMQKEAEMCHKENERLQTELQMMKQDLLGAEKAALTVNELKQHIKDLEEQQLHLNDEANELREQNELLEFRILELEDDNDKLDMDGTCEGHCQRLENLLRKSSNQLEGQEKRCLQQLLQCVQQLDLDAGMPVDQSKSERTRHNRIVATVQPYSNSATPSAPPTPSKRYNSHSGSAWQSNSLSESGVFVECDLSVPPPHPHLQFYQERLDQLEGKLLVYESSGETQAKHLAQRLQRELQLEKELKELRDRQDQLIAENASIEEAKCEFEEAENDTRLHLQRNEVELEILRQRNVELEFGKDALCAKYKDCRAECAILRDDLSAAETQLEHLHSERRTAKRELDSLRRSLPLLLIYRLWSIARMGNELSTTTDAINTTQSHRAEDDGEPHLKGGQETMKQTYCQLPNRNIETNECGCREINYLKEEVKGLRCQLKDVNSRHYEAMETADSHWVELEREYKQREEAYRTKEVCLKQKIAKLQDCLREDARAAAEKIQQLEEAEHGLKTCLVRLTKEHRDLLEENHTLQNSMESSKAQLELEAEQQQPLAVALENERRRSQALIDDLSFSKKLQHNTEEQLKQETDGLRNQIYSLKKDFMHIEVTNGELKEEVGTLEKKIGQMELQLKDSEEKTRCLEDELRTKEEQCQIMEQKLGVCPEGFSLADELYDSPAKRAKRDEIKDLQTASQGLGCALRDIERRERELPTHKDFQTIACSVKQLADTLLCAKNPSEVSSACLCQSGDEVSAKAMCKPCDEMDLDQAKPTSSKQTINQGITERSMSQPSSRRGSQASRRSSQPTSPSRRNSRPGGSSAKSARSQGGGTSQKEDGSDFCVGLPLGDSENNICKVPSSMVQFVTQDKQLDKLECQTLAEKPISLRRKRQLCKRFIYRRMFRVRARRTAALPHHLEHSLSNNSFYSAVSVHTVHSSKSMLSLNSQHAAILPPQWEQWTAVAVAQTDPIEKQCCEVQVSPSNVDVTIQVQPSTAEFGVQADNIGVEHRLLLLPTRTRRFIKLLQDAVKGHFKVDMFRERLLQAWESSEVFRENMELLQNLYVDKPGPKYESPDSWESYEGFVSVVNCIRTLKSAFRPNISTMLVDLEENINSRIVAFHNRKIESEYYCTLYYPVERRNSMIFTTDEE